MMDLAYVCTHGALSHAAKAVQKSDLAGDKGNFLSDSSLRLMHAAKEIRMQKDPSQHARLALPAVEALSWALQIWDQAIEFRRYREAHGPPIRPESLNGSERTRLEEEVAKDATTYLTYAQKICQLWADSLEKTELRQAA
jgi:hypothetical protein